MQSIKSYTDLEQSHKLSEVLPIESADMYYRTTIVGIGMVSNTPIIGKRITRWDIPCWSLAALLSVMICPNLEEYIKGKWDLTTFTDESLKTPVEIQDCKDPVDACVAIIEKLHEMKML